MPSELREPFVQLVGRVQAEEALELIFDEEAEDALEDEDSPHISGGGFSPVRQHVSVPSLQQYGEAPGMQQMLPLQCLHWSLHCVSINLL